MRISCTVLFSFFLFLLPEITTAQNPDLHFCGTQDGKVEWLKNYQSNPQLYPVGNDTLYVPMSIHLVGTDSGSGYFGTRQILNAMCTLNKDFEEAKIRFYIAGDFNYIANTDYYDHTFAQGQEMMEIYRVPNTINTYFVDSPAGNCGYSSYNLGLAMNKSCSGSNDHTWAHEVGHFLSLPHPFWGWEGNPVTPNEPAPLQWNDILVERMDGVDCHLAGDGFCDTAPDYLNYRWGCNADNVSSVTQTDPNGETFVSDGTLFMSYAFDNCMSRFSEEQIAAMRANLLTEKADHLQPNLPDMPIDTSAALIIAPEEGVILTENENVYFEWAPIPGVSDYILEITIFTPFNTPLYSFYIEDATSYTVEYLPKDKTTYWRLRPYNSSYTCADYTAIATFTTGETISAVSGIPSINELSLQPNPVHASSSLLVSLESTELLSAEISVVNVAGQSQVVGNQYFNVGENQFEIPTDNLSPGIYFLQMQSAQGVLSQKFVVW